MEKKGCLRWALMCFYVPCVLPELCQMYTLSNAPFSALLVAAERFIFSMNFKGHFHRVAVRGGWVCCMFFFPSSSEWQCSTKHIESVGFSCDLDLEHFSEVLFPVTTPKLWVGDERECRVLHDTCRRIRWWFRKLFLLAKYAFGLWAQWNNLCLSCAWLTKSVRVTEGRTEPL